MSGFHVDPGYRGQLAFAVSTRDRSRSTSGEGSRSFFAGLSKKLKDQDKSLGDRIHVLEREQTYYRGIGVLVLAIAVGFSVNWLKDTVAAKPQGRSPVAGSVSAPAK